MIAMEESPSVAPPAWDDPGSQPPAVDPQAFALLFFDVPANQKVIWHQMSRIVLHASRGVRVRNLHDLEEFKGDALNLAIESINLYSPHRKTAYQYFYKIVRNHMRKLANAKNPSLLGDIDVHVSLDEMYHFPEKYMVKTRQNNPATWKSYRLRSHRDRSRADSYFRRRLRVCADHIKTLDSDAEKAAVRWMAESLQQTARALIGNRVPSVTFP